MPRSNLEPPHYDGVESLAMKNDVIFSGSRDNSIKKWNYTNHGLEHVSIQIVICIIIVDGKGRFLI